METKKKAYTAPATEVTHVEIESSICGGSSVDFNDETKNSTNVEISGQTIDKDFEKNNDFSSGGGWD
ncbi:MAG: hypothetical protein K2O88_08200 [Paramuribaculum sp.]|nr:hypothetical protein [Paramuribaculum sp.]